MTQWRRTSIISVAALVLGLLGFGGNPARAQGIPIPEAESNLFILDVSGSVNSAELWKSLKNSSVSKLEQPFGSPITKDGKIQQIHLFLLSWTKKIVRKFGER